jgi:hypothetical protein
MLMAIAILTGGCGQLVKVEPVKIQPIHITVDVNLKDGSGPGSASPTGETKPP